MNLVSEHKPRGALGPGGDGVGGGVGSCVESGCGPEVLQLLTSTSAEETPTWEWPQDSHLKQEVGALGHVLI